MSEDLATLKIVVDTTQLKIAASEMTKLADAAKKLSAVEIQNAKLVLAQQKQSLAERKQLTVENNAAEKLASNERIANGKLELAQRRQSFTEEKAISNERRRIAVEENVYSAAGIKTLEERRQKTTALSAAMKQLQADHAANIIVGKEYERMHHDIVAAQNLAIHGNSRHRGAIRQTAAAMASLTFEMTGAIYGLVALGGALAAPALFGTAMLKRVEDAQTGVAGILLSMGELNGKALTFGQAWQASSQYVKQVQQDSMKYGIDMGRLMEVNQAAISGGLNAMLTLEQVQKVATAGAIAVSSLGLSSQQYVQEVRDLISGGIQPASSTLARSIGVTDALLKQWKAEGPDKLVKELTDRLQGFLVVADEVRSKTLTGAWDILQARLSMLLSDEQGFGAIKKVVLDIANYIGTVDDVSKKFTLNPEAIAMAKAYWDVLKAIGSAFSIIGDLLQFISPLLAKFSQGIQILAIEAKMLFSLMSTSIKQFLALATFDWSGFKRAGSEGADSIKKLIPELEKAGKAFAGMKDETNSAKESQDEMWKSITGGVQAKSFDELNKLYDEDVRKKSEHDAKVLLLNQQVWAAQLKQGTIYYEAMEKLRLYNEQKAKGTTGLGTSSVSGVIVGVDKPIQAEADAAMKELQSVGDSYGKWLDSLNEKQKKSKAIKVELTEQEKIDIQIQKDIIAEYERKVKQMDSNNESLAKSNDALRIHNSEIGKTKEEIAMLAVERENHAIKIDEEALAILDATFICSAESEALRENIKLRKEHRELSGQTAIIEADKAAIAAASKAEQDAINAASKTAQDAIAAEIKAQEDKWKMIDGFAHDAFNNILDKGQNVFKSIGDAIKKYLLDMLYKMTVQKWVISITASMGMTGVAQAGQTASALSGIGDIGSVFGNIGSSISGLFAPAATGMAAMSGSTAVMTESAFAAANAITGTTAAATTATSALGALGSTVAAALPWVAGALAIYSLVKGNGGTPTQSLGHAVTQFDITGKQTDTYSLYGGSSAGVDAQIQSMQTGYMKAAMALGIGTAAQQWGFAMNTGENSKQQMFGLSGGAFAQTETAYSDAALQLAASRAVFSALQGSELPKYLMNVFDPKKYDVSAMSQQDIDNAMAFATSLKQMRDGLTETRTPLEVMTQQMTDSLMQLGTSAETFKTDFVAAIDAGITPETYQSWINLGTTIDAVTVATNDAAVAAKEMADAALNASLQMIQSSANYASAVAEFQGAGAITKAEMGMSTAVETLNAVVADNLGWVFTNAYEAATLSPEQLAVINALPNANEVMGYITTLVQAGTAYNSAVAEVAAATAAAVPSIYDGVIAIDDYTTTVLDATALQTEQLSLLAQIYELTNNELGKDAVLQQQRLLALEELNKQDPSGHLERLTKNLWYLQDAAAEAEAALQLSNDSLALQSQLYELTGDTVAAAAVLELQRAAVIADLMKQDPTGELAAWQMQIDSWTDSVNAATLATADTDAAFAALQRAIDAETKLIEDTYTAAYKAMQDQADISAESWQIQIDAAQEGADKIRSVYDSLKSTLEELTAPTYAQAQATLAAALAYSTAGGSLVDYAGFDAALQSIKNQDSTQYASAIDMARDAAITQNILTGLTTNAGSQLTVADYTLKAIEDNAKISATGFEDALIALTEQRDLDIAGLNAQLDLAQSQLDALNGIDNSIMSVAAALTLLASAMGAQSAANPYAKGKLVTETGFNATKYLAANPDVASLWEGTALQHFQMFGQFEGRTYATGGIADGWSMVGEQGPEIVNFTQPGRVYTAKDTAKMFAANDDSASEIKQLRAEFQSVGVALAKNTGEIAKILRKFDGDGMPAERVIAA